MYKKLALLLDRASSSRCPEEHLLQASVIDAAGLISGITITNALIRAAPNGHERGRR